MELEAGSEASEVPSIQKDEHKNVGKSVIGSSIMPSRGKESIRLIASKIASQPLQNFEPDAWGVLTAISKKARDRLQGINIVLTADEHFMGRVVKDIRFQIEAIEISSVHCRIFRKNFTAADMKKSSISEAVFFLKDISTNGTYHNWHKLRKSETMIVHGDIISFAVPPQHESAFAFVFREAKFGILADGLELKRKTCDDSGDNSKRFRGIGIGLPDGPLSLDDFRKLQRSNTELRKQLEDQVTAVTILNNENRSFAERHEIELKEAKEMVTKSYLVQLEELQQLLEVKRNELSDASKISSEQNHAMHDVMERLSATVQSCNEANEVINSQKASIIELKGQLDDEREQRREERDKFVTDLKASVQKVQIEGQEELKRFSDTSLRREKELQEVINKLQELEKERCLLVETLRTKLEDTRQKLVVADNKVHQLESQLSQEQHASASERKRAEELEHEVKRVGKELDCEKAAREEAWAKVSALELKITAAVRDIDFEKRRLKDARERIILRETQLRSFYSTTEEISVLFAKQQEQLKSMQRTLEDEDNYQYTHFGRSHRDSASPDRSPSRAGSSASTQRVAGTPTKATAPTEEASATGGQECDGRSPAEGCNAEDMEFASSEPALCYHISPADLTGTEKVPETESPDDGLGGRKADGGHVLFGGDTMQLDEKSEEKKKEGAVQDEDEGTSVRPEVAGDRASSPGEKCEGRETSLSEDHAAVIRPAMGTEADGFELKSYEGMVSSDSDDTTEGCADTDDDDGISGVGSSSDGLASGSRNEESDEGLASDSRNEESEEGLSSDSRNEEFEKEEEM